MLPKCRSTLLRYLDKVAALYPAGIPRSALKHAAKSASQLKCAIIVVTAQGALTTAESLLLDSICSKALKLTPEQYRTTVAASSEQGLAIERSSVGEVPTALTIVFGSEQELGSLNALDQTMVLRTHGLAEMEQSQELKRTVWGHLKGVVSYLQ